MKYIGLHSKFVYDTSNVLGVRETAKDLCEKWDYQLAEVESIADISQIGAFLKCMSDQYSHYILIYLQIFYFQITYFTLLSFIANGYQNRIWHLGKII